MNMKRFQKLKTQVEELRRNKDRAEGSLGQLMKELKENFDVDTIEEGKELVEKLELEAEKAEAKFETALADFEDKWGDELKERS